MHSQTVADSTYVLIQNDNGKKQKSTSKNYLWRGLRYDFEIILKVIVLIVGCLIVVSLINDVYSAWNESLSQINSMELLRTNQWKSELGNTRMVSRQPNVNKKNFLENTDGNKFNRLLAIYNYFINN